MEPTDELDQVIRRKPRQVYRWARLQGHPQSSALVAWYVGLDRTPQTWKYDEVVELLFLRHLVVAGRLGGPSDRASAND